MWRSAVAEHQDEVDCALLAKAGQPAQQRFPARLAEHIDDEEDIRARRPDWSF